MNEENNWHLVIDADMAIGPVERISHAEIVNAIDLNLYLSSNLSTTTVDGSAIDLFFTAVIAVILIKQKIAQTRISKSILK